MSRGMYDLGQKRESMPKIGTPDKGPSYHQTVNIRGAKDLARHAVGKRLKFRAEGVVRAHRMNDSGGNVEHNTEIELHKLGVAGEAKPAAGRRWCPKCGNVGGGKYCPECGEATVEAKGKDKTSDEDQDD